MTPLTPSLLSRLENAVRNETRGELESALERYRSVLEQEPDNFEALSLLGRLEYRLGDNGAAVFHLQRAVRLAPGRADVHLGLGYALASSGDQRRSVRSFLDALEADSTYAPAFVSLGCVFAQHEQHELAQRAFDFARQAGSEYPEVHYQLGKYYADTGHTEPALAALLNAQRLGGRFDDIHIMLARLYSMQGAYPQALERLDHHVAIYPNDTEASVIRAATLIELGRYEHAQNACQLALQFEPRNVDALVMIGRIHYLRDDMEGARRSYQTAISMDSDLAAGHAGLSEVCAREGDLNNALHHIKRAGDPKNYDLRTALLCTRLLRLREQHEEAIRLLSNRLKNRRDHVAGRRKCHFTLGELHEVQQDYARAYKHYTLANELRQSLQKPLSVGALSLLSYFNSDRMARLRRGEVAAPQPVFVVGAPGFAFEVVKHLLQCHPEIELSNNKLPLVELAKTVPSFLATPKPFPEALVDARVAELKKLSTQFRETNFKQNVRIVIDAHFDNALYLGFASLLFPNLRVIHVVQDTTDSALDIYTSESPPSCVELPTDMPSIKLRLEQLQATMSHWNALREFPSLSINYEKLVARPKEGLERMLGFIGVESHPVLFARLRKQGPDGDLLSIARGKVGKSLPFKPYMDDFPDRLSAHDLTF